MSKLYHKEKVIGSGTFGNVWLVKSKVTNGLFVLKEINLSTMDATETQQALNEVTILSRCRHRNIIKYKDAHIDHKKRMLSIVMEYADGGDLFTAIMKQKGVYFKDYNVISWFTQICLALQYIHHMGILHRDLKSRNIFLTRDKEIKIGDFGIARCLMETSELATTAIGTPYYLSPEICHQKPYNHKSDMWAAGCVLFEMTALHHPFEALNLAHLLTLIISGKRKPLPRHCCSLIRDLVQKLLDENPETRPSADDILVLPALQPYLSEVWKVQTYDTSSSVSKILNEKINTRRYSMGEKDLDSNGLPLQRRASISSVDAKGVKTRFGFANKGKNVQALKSTPSSRPHSVKVFKNAPKISAVKKEQYMTYKVLNPVTLKDRIANILCNGLKASQSGKNSLKRVDSCKSRKESDCSNKNEESLDSVQDSFASASSSILPTTSTRKHIEVPNFNIVDDDVFDTHPNDAKDSQNGNRIPHSGCPHSQCQQCMIDMLWKNRIRGVIGPVLKTDERLDLIKKLQTVFGEDFFDTVYHALASNWENNENSETPKSLKNLTNSLNFSQLQHLPLVMQLIQLDLVMK